MQSLIDQLCPTIPDIPTIQASAPGKPRGQSPAFLAEARVKALEKYSGGTTIHVSRTTFTGLRHLFGEKLKARHLREFLDDLATGQYKITRVKPKPIVNNTSTSTTTSHTTGPGWTLHQVAAEFSVPYYVILHRVRQGFIVATKHGKRRFVISNAEVDRLRTVGIR